MNELVHSILHSRLLASARLPSFAGSGLPERIRSTAFALLGLTAAAGLALVAIFAQLSFPLLDPAPLPDEPTVSESIAGAEKVRLHRGPEAFASVRPAQPVSPSHPRQVSPGPSSSAGTVGSPDETPTVSEPSGAETPAPAVVPGPSSGDKNGGGEVGGESGGGSNLAPTAAADPASTSPATPAPAASPAPAPAASSPTPELVSPGNSSAAAAASHASERGVEASTASGHDK